MHQVFATVVQPLLGVTGDQAIVEVGAGTGRLTRRLVEGSTAVVHAVDPAALFDPETLTNSPERLLLYSERSHAVLRGLPAVGLAILDGDPNYHTVAGELALLADRRRAGDTPAPVVVVHNVGWPFGRRDGYYDPGSIPEQARSPYAAMGLVPGRNAPSSDGVELVPFVAQQERLPRTGVRTAVDDFVADHGDRWRSIYLPGLHGVAVLAARERLESEPELAAVLDGFERPEFLLALVESVERERVAALARAAAAPAPPAAVNGHAQATVSTLDEIDAERLDALQTRLEVLERDRDGQLRDALERLRILDDERAEMVREVTEAQVRLEAALRDRDASDGELHQAARRLAELERATRADASHTRELVADVEREQERAQRHERSLEHAHDEARRLREKLDAQTAAWLAERKLIGEQVDRAAQSRAWRIGHRITSAGARITFHRNRGTSALSKLQQRLDRTPDELQSGPLDTPALTAGSEPEL